MYHLTSLTLSIFLWQNVSIELLGVDRMSKSLSETKFADFIGRGRNLVQSDVQVVPSTGTSLGRIVWECLGADSWHYLASLSTNVAQDGVVLQGSLKDT